MGIAVGLAGAAVVGVAACAGPGVRPAGPSGNPGAPVGGGAQYQPGPGDPRLRGPGDMVMQMATNKWHSHLLPFGSMFPDRASLMAEIKRARALKLFQ